MNYAFIKSPITNRFYDVNSLTGRYVLQNYINQLGGKKSAGCSTLRMKDCKSHSDCDWRKNAKGKNTCQNAMNLKIKRKSASRALLVSPKKSPVKRSPVKRSPVKRSSVKRAPVKKASAKKTTLKTYYTTDNGAQPFKVVIDNKQVYVYKFQKYNQDTDTFLYSEKPIQHYIVKKVFIGKSNLSSDNYYPGSQYDGNSILLQITKNKYVFIGDRIFSFTSKSEIKKFVSPMGNSMNSYPFAIDINGRYYFLSTDPGPVIIDKIPQSSLKKDYHNDPSHFYFQNKHLSSKLTIKIIKQ